MSSTAARLPNFVIGGTEKAGTTSVFDWLSMHPQVHASLKKETDFFREQFTGDPEVDARGYAAFFEPCAPDARIVMEASPGYLGEAAIVAPRMRALIPDAKLLFILRDPVERLYSSYHFHRGRLNLPPDVTFEDYVARCIEFDRRVKGPDELGLDEWYLKVLRFGCYADFIAIFRSQMEPGHIKVMFFEALREDERTFMVELSEFLGIDADFWAGFEFRKSNVTFSARNTVLHRVAVRMNAICEPLLRRNPALKQSLVRVYKGFNQEREGYDPMSPAVREQLREFYRPAINALQQQLGASLPETWRYQAGRASS